MSAWDPCPPAGYLCPSQIQEPDTTGLCGIADHQVIDSNLFSLSCNWGHPEAFPCCEFILQRGILSLLSLQASWEAQDRSSKYREGPDPGWDHFPIGRRWLLTLCPEAFLTLSVPHRDREWASRVESILPRCVVGHKVSRHHKP